MLVAAFTVTSAGICFFFCAIGLEESNFKLVSTFFLWRR
jgi:hypothetical protein